MSIAFAKLAYEFTPHQVMVSIQKLFPDACIQADPEGMWGMLNIDGCLFNAKSPTKDFALSQNGDGLLLLILILILILLLMLLLIRILISIIILRLILISLMILLLILILIARVLILSRVERPLAFVAVDLSHGFPRRSNCWS